MTTDVLLPHFASWYIYFSLDISCWSSALISSLIYLKKFLHYLCHLHAARSFAHLSIIPCTAIWVCLMNRLLKAPLRCDICWMMLLQVSLSLLIFSLKIVVANFSWHKHRYAYREADACPSGWGNHVQWASQWGHMEEKNEQTELETERESSTEKEILCR